MCLSIPAKIVKLRGAVATVDVMGNRREADVSLVDEPKIGDYVLLHAGFAIEKMSADDAAESLKIWEELASLDSGELRATSFEPPEESKP